MHDRIGRPRPASAPPATTPEVDPRIRDFETEGLIAGWQYVRMEPGGPVKVVYSAGRYLPNPPEIRAELERRSRREFDRVTLHRLGLPKEFRP